MKPEHRGRGIGKALLATLAEGRPVERGCGRLEWSVLDWNTPSIGVLRVPGARPMDEWTVYRVDDEALARLAGLDPDGPRVATGMSRYFLPHVAGCPATSRASSPAAARSSS